MPHKIDYPADPDRCQAIAGQQGQCMNKRASPETKYCETHGGVAAIKSAEANSVRNFRLTRWRIRMHEYADSEGVKSLREEIGILRLLLEETLERCETAADLVMQSQHISDLVLRVEKLVTSCHNMETKTGNVLDKSALIAIAGEWLVSLEKIIPKEQVDIVATNLMDIIERKGEVNALPVNSRD